MCLALVAVGALPACDAVAAVNRVVTTCADSTALPDCSNNDNVTLRKALFCAQNKDTVDLTQLQCSAITLAESLVAGTISVSVNGPGRDKLTIDAGNQSRAFIHNGVNANTLTISKLTIVNGRYDNPYDYSNGGGCIYSSAFLALNAVTVSSCYTSAVFRPANGGAIFAHSGVTLTDSTVTGSTAHDRNGQGSFGGGIASPNSVGLIRSTVSDNTASSSAHGLAKGGGIFAGDFSAVASTISGNGTDSVGGGIHCQFLGLTDSTVSGNHTSSSGVVGGVYVGQQADVRNSTIANNASAVGFPAGLYIRVGVSANSFINSTIIANNISSVGELDVGTDPGKKIYGGNNLIVATLSGTGVPADTISLDPKLGPLQANGGPTLTLAVLPGSPAIDMGSNLSNLMFDQRGVPRVENGRADIGAVESDDLFRDGFDK
jgi:hypothetical protein